MQILNESTLSKFFKYQSERSFGIITAFRGGYGFEVNIQLNRKLHNDLTSKGLVADIILNGIYKENYGTEEEKEVKEKAFLVFPKIGTDGELTGLKKILMKLGEKYDQDSILYKSVYDDDAYLIGTSKRETAYPDYHVEENLGKFHPKLIGEFYSRMRGLPFSFSDGSGTYDDSYKESKRERSLKKSQALKKIRLESVELILPKSIDRHGEVFLAKFIFNDSLYDSILEKLRG